MKNKVSDIQSKSIKKMTPIVLVGVLYFGLLAFTMYQKISRAGVTEYLVQMSIIVIAFAFGGYYMYFSSLRKIQKRHVSDNSRMEEFEISKWIILTDKIIATLCIIVGVLFMLFTLL
ncbi:MAG: hypothetical protein ACYDEX_19695 [Mobilitalea sp.]